MICAHVIVRPRTSVFDPQGEAVRRALLAQGLEEIKSVRIGKYIELELAGEEPSGLEATRAQLETICRELLSNPVIEQYELALSFTQKPSPAAVLAT